MASKRPATGQKSAKSTSSKTVGEKAVEAPAKQVKDVSEDDRKKAIRYIEGVRSIGIHWQHHIEKLEKKYPHSVINVYRELVDDVKANNIEKAARRAAKHRKEKQPLVTTSMPADLRPSGPVSSSSGGGSGTTASSATADTFASHNVTQAMLERQSGRPKRHSPKPSRLSQVQERKDTSKKLPHDPDAIHFGLSEGSSMAQDSGFHSENLFNNVDPVATASFFADDAATNYSSVPQGVSTAGSKPVQKKRKRSDESMKAGRLSSKDRGSGDDESQQKRKITKFSPIVKPGCETTREKHSNTSSGTLTSGNEESSQTVLESRPQKDTAPSKPEIGPSPTAVRQPRSRSIVDAFTDLFDKNAENMPGVSHQSAPSIGLPHARGNSSGLLNGASHPWTVPMPIDKENVPPATSAMDQLQNASMINDNCVTCPIQDVRHLAQAGVKSDIGNGGSASEIRHADNNQDSETIRIIKSPGALQNFLNSFCGAMMNGPMIQENSLPGPSMPAFLHQDQLHLKESGLMNGVSVHTAPAHGKAINALHIGSETAPGLHTMQAEARREAPPSSLSHLTNVAQVAVHPLPVSLQGQYAAASGPSTATQLPIPADAAVAFPARHPGDERGSNVQAAAVNERPSVSHRRTTDKATARDRDSDMAVEDLKIAPAFRDALLRLDIHRVSDFAKDSMGKEEIRLIVASISDELKMKKSDTLVAIFRITAALQRYEERAGQ